MSIRYYPVSDIHIAVKRYAEMTGTSFDFWDWLGIEWGSSVRGGFIHQPTGDRLFMMTENSAHKLELLLSTHYRTLWKAHEIQRGEPCQP